MADFNVQLKDAPSTADLMGLSRGAAPVKAREYSVDTSAAMRTKGLADMVEMGATLFNTTIKAADDLIKEDINQTTTAEMDQIYSEMGVDDVSIMGRSTTNEPLPSEIGVAEKNLNRLNQARARGTLSENSYWARVESVSRQLRARYPGHRDYIDQRISSVSGGKPANEIMKNLIQQSNAAASASNASYKAKLSYVERLNFAGVEPPKDWEKMPLEDIINQTGVQVRQKAQIEMQKSNYELAKTKNEVSNLMIEDNAKTIVHNHLTRAAQAFTSESGNFAEFRKSLIEATAKGDKTPLNDEQLNTLRTNFNNFKLEFMNGLNEELMGSYPLSKKQLDDAVAPATMWLDNYEQALINKDYGFLYSTANKLEAMKTSDSVKLLSGFPELRGNVAVRNTLGEIAGTTLINNSEKLATAESKAMFSESFQRLFSDPKASVSAELDKAARDPNYATAVIQAPLDVLSNPMSKPEAFVQSATVLFGENNASMLSKIKPDKRIEVYNRLVNQNTFERMKAMREAGYTKEFDAYVGWVEFNFGNLSRQHASALARSIDASGTAGDSVVFNTESGQFEVRTPPDIKGIEKQAYYNLEQNVKPVNSAIRGILPILKERGTDVGDFVTQVFGGIGLDTKIIKPTGPSKLGVGTTGSNSESKFTWPFNPDFRPRLVSDPNTDSAVLKFKPGDPSFLKGDKQVEPIDGDGIQLEELTQYAREKQSNMNLFRQLMIEQPNNPDVIDQFERSLYEWSQVMQEINSISKQWADQFSREIAKKTTDKKTK